MLARKLSRIVGASLLLLVLIGWNVRMSDSLQTNSVVSSGDLRVDYGVPVGQAFLSIEDFNSGETYQRQFAVTNISPVRHILQLTGNLAPSSKLKDTDIFITIFHKGATIYGSEDSPKRLADFAGDQPIELTSLPSGSSDEFMIRLKSPSQMQDTQPVHYVGFNAQITPRKNCHVILSEIYSHVDKNHGQDKVNEWVELYNPTDKAVSLKGWTLEDNSKTAIPLGNATLGPRSYLLISRSNSTYKYWDEKPAAKVALGSLIGNGLEEQGDHLLLKDAKGTIMDQVSWGNDLSIFAVKAVLEGSSLRRELPALDTDSPSDWQPSSTPSPGY